MQAPMKVVLIWKYTDDKIHFDETIRQVTGVAVVDGTLRINHRLPRAVAVTSVDLAQLRRFTVSQDQLTEAAVNELASQALEAMRA